MSTTVEWYAAEDTAVWLVLPGQDWDGCIPEEHDDPDAVPEGKVAVAFDGQASHASLLIGTYDDVHTKLTNALLQLEQARERGRA